MRLWRISNHASLSGEGGLHASGRWHTRGRRVVYLADYPASALLEVMVHLEIDPEDLPTHYQLLGIDVPEDVSVMRLAENELPDGWRTQIALTRTRGDEWLRAGTAALLCIPSVIVPDTTNYVLNPAHSEAARISTASTLRAPFDQRLMAFLKT